MINDSLNNTYPTRNVDREDMQTLEKLDKTYDSLQEDKVLF